MPISSAKGMKKAKSPVAAGADKRNLSRLRGQGTSLDRPSGPDVEMGHLDKSAQISADKPSGLSQTIGTSLAKDDAPSPAATTGGFILKQLPSAAACLAFTIAVVVGSALLYAFVGVGAAAVPVDSDQCFDLSSAPEYESTLVFETLSDHCGCVPTWMGGGVYFAPSTTLYLAIAAVLGFLVLNRMVPLLKLAVAALFSSKHVHGVALKFLDAFKLASPSVRSICIAAVQEVYPGMPSNLLKIAESTGVSPSTAPPADDCKLSDTTMTVAEELEKLSGTVISLDALNKSVIKTANKERGANTADVRAVLTAMLALAKGSAAIEVTPTTDVAVASKDGDDGTGGLLRELGDPDWVEWYLKSSKDNQGEVEAALLEAAIDLVSGGSSLEQSSRDDTAVMLALQLILGLGVLFDYFLVQQWPSGDSWECRWAYVTGVVMYKPFTVPMWFCLTTCCHYTFADQLYGLSGRDDVTGTPHGAPLTRSRATLAMIAIVFGMEVAWLLIALPIALPLLASFFPVVMLPAFLIPTLLILGWTVGLEWAVMKASLYFKAFALQVVNRNGLRLASLPQMMRGDRDVVLTAVNQNIKVFKFISEELRLDREFMLAAVTLNGNALEFASKELQNDRIVVLAGVKQNGNALQYASISLKYDQGFNDDLRLVRNISNNNESHEDPKPSKRLAPVEFNETVFALKATATMLVSVTILSMHLLPFYDKGAAWWSQGAQLFLLRTFDLPELFRVQFALAFDWPRFRQPRLSFQLAAGLLLLVLQLLFRFGKWLLRRFAVDLRLEATKPQREERRLMRSFALGSWLPFRKPMEVVQTTLGSTWEVWKDQLSSKGVTTTQRVGALCVAGTKPQTKTFGGDAGDDDVVTFCNQEGCMAFRNVVMISPLTTGLSLQHLTQRCPWLVTIDFSNCKSMNGE